MNQVALLPGLSCRRSITPVSRKPRSAINNTFSIFDVLGRSAGAFESSALQFAPSLGKRRYQGVIETWNMLGQSPVCLPGEGIIFFRVCIPGDYVQTTQFINHLRCFKNSKPRNFARHQLQDATAEASALDLCAKKGQRVVKGSYECSGVAARKSPSLVDRIRRDNRCIVKDDAGVEVATFGEKNIRGRYYGNVVPR